MQFLKKFIKYTYSKHGFSFLLPIAVVVIGIILGMIDITQGYQGGALITSFILFILFIGLFLNDYWRNGK